MFCLGCGKTIEPMTRNCPYCGENQRIDALLDGKPIISVKKGKKKKERFEFSDEEILALGLYPKDEGYKMSLISRILNKK